MNSNLDLAINYAFENYQSFIKDLSSLISIKTISANSEYSEEFENGAKWIANYLDSLGSNDTRILKSQKHPIVFGNITSSEKNRPTILVYGHYDVQPADPLELWHSDPYTATIKDNLLFARGSSDMKGQMIVVLAALKSIINTGSLPVNIKFLFEGDEEIGSPGIKEFLYQHKEIFKCDFVLNLDAGMITADKPTIVYGLRGLAYFEINLTGPAQDLHSGMFGGIVYNPIQALSELIAGMKNTDGVIKLPGFYDDVLQLSDEEKKELEKLEMDEQFYKDHTGVNKLYGEKGYSPVERIGARPALDVNGIFGGYISEGPKTVIPSKAMAKISMRLVPNQTPKKVNDQMVKYMENNVPEQIKWEIKMLSSDPASLTDINYPATKCFAESIEKVWGVKPVYQRGGGSIPIVAYMQEILGAESVLSGFSLPEDNIHSPNERLNLDVFKKGIDTTIHFIFNAGDKCEIN